ncbi:hypothetical protein DET60_102602 [Raoultella planticola]|nr:hypothetical protein DET60_102602 [Raoultella planticola]
MTSSPARYRNRSKHQVPGRGTDDWQRMRFCNLPGGATLARAYPETTLTRACREQRLRGLPEQRFCRSGQASAATRRKPAQSLNHFISAPDEVLMTGNACAFAICPAALRLHGPTRKQRLRGPAGTAFARTCREQRLRGLPEQRFCRSGQASAATRRKPAQSLNHFISAPDEVLTAGKAYASAICPAALRLHGPTRNNAYAGLPEQRLHGPAANNAYAACRNSAFVGRVRRQPPPDAGASRTAAMAERV